MQQGWACVLWMMVIISIILSGLTCKNAIGQSCTKQQEHHAVAGFVKDKGSIAWNTREKRYGLLTRLWTVNKDFTKRVEILLACPMIWDNIGVPLHHHREDVRLCGGSCSIFASTVILHKAKATGMQALPFQDGQSLMWQARTVLKLPGCRRDGAITSSWPSWYW